ncbi:hypothetical protein RB653_006205 [Dictyostelium firmibasis]|uniref:Uncharacterized protein n=1 Tax=Dictyostelium firmibasis TaxID=79012 RepID=A0AAN7UAW3_9MYCE
MSFKTVKQTEVNVGTINVNIIESGVGKVVIDGVVTNFFKSAERFDLSFSGIPKVVACIRNIEPFNNQQPNGANRIKGGSNQISIKSNISNITCDGFDYECEIQGNGSSFTIDYTAVYHVNSNPISKFYNRKVCIKSVPYGTYLSDNNGVIEMSEKLRKYEEWFIERAVTGPNSLDTDIYLYSKTFNKYLTYDPLTNQLSHGSLSENCVWRLEVGQLNDEKFTLYSDTFNQYNLRAFGNGDTENGLFLNGDQESLFDVILLKQ